MLVAGPSRQTQNVESVRVWCWTTVYDAEPTLVERCVFAGILLLVIAHLPGEDLTCVGERMRYCQATKVKLVEAEGNETPCWSETALHSQKSHMTLLTMKGCFISTGGTLLLKWNSSSWSKESYDSSDYEGLFHFNRGSYVPHLQLSSCLIRLGRMHVPVSQTLKPK